MLSGVFMVLKIVKLLIKNKKYQKNMP